MSTNAARRVPEDEAASLAEIEAAIAALTDADIQKLLRVARRRVWVIGRVARGRTAEDLLQEAFAALLDDTRRWNKAKVSFFALLCGAVRSIASNWAKTLNDDEEPLLAVESEWVNSKGERHDLYEGAADGRPRIDRQMELREHCLQIDRLFADDPEALQVLEAWGEGYDPPATRELWELSQNQYNTIVRRIRRRVEAAGMTGEVLGGQHVN